MDLYNQLTNIEKQKLIQLSRRYGLTLNQLIDGIIEESEHESLNTYSALSGVVGTFHDKA